MTISATVSETQARTAYFTCNKTIKVKINV